MKQILTLLAVVVVVSTATIMATVSANGIEKTVRIQEQDPPTPPACMAYAGRIATEVVVQTDPTDPDQKVTLPEGSAITFAMLSGVWNYTTGSQLQLGQGTPVTWQQSPGGPWQTGITEAPIMITLN